MLAQQKPIVKSTLASLFVAVLLFAMPARSHASTFGSIRLTPTTRRRPSSSEFGCISDWYVSYSGTGNWTLINTDPDGLPITDLYFSRAYHDPLDVSRGYLDFNKDGKSDIFSAVPLGDGNYRWRYSSGGTSAWINLAYDSTPPDQLRFGDFDRDGYTDVFSALPIGGGALQWRYSPGGATSYVNLRSYSTPLDQLRFGDFSGDGTTDIFTLTPDIIYTNLLDWMVSYSGTTSYIMINSLTTPLSEMRFGDINGDGTTDVFTTVTSTISIPGFYDWYYSSAGSGVYQFILSTNLSVHDVRLVGDFNGDHRTDFFFTSLRQDGLYQWHYFYYKTNPPDIDQKELAYDGTPPDQLRFADFNGDGITDVFKSVRRCNLYLPLIER